MSFVTSSRNKIQLEETQFSAACSESMANRFAAAINFIIDNFDVSNPEIGAVRESELSEAAFQLAIGTNWVLANGQAVPLTAYATQIGPNVPDLRGTYVRGKNNGAVGEFSNPAGDVAVGTFATDNFVSHSHLASIATTLATFFGGGLQVPKAGADMPRKDLNSGNVANLAVSFLAPDVTPPTVVDVESRPRSVTLNFFVKVDL